MNKIFNQLTKQFYLMIFIRIITIIVNKFLNIQALPCAPNSMYGIKAECPQTCLFPNGNPDCGTLYPTEGCYCNAGYVLDSSGNCILPTNCGCLLPDNSTSIGVSSV